MTSVIAGARFHSGSYHGGELPRHFLLVVCLKELSFFIDESGDFGEYEYHSPYYIVTLLFHNQADDINRNISQLDDKLKSATHQKKTVHTGPLIRREYEYKDQNLLERKRIFNILYNFTRTANISYHSIIVEKKQLSNEADLTERITIQLSAFLRKHYVKFMEFDYMVVYYDYGQRELTNVLVSVLSALLSNVEYRKVSPSDYKLFQAADMLCTLELLAIKAKKNILSNSELTFFSSVKNLNKAYIRAIKNKRIV